MEKADDITESCYQAALSKETNVLTKQSKGIFDFFYYAKPKPKPYRHFSEKILGMFCRNLEGTKFPLLFLKISEIISNSFMCYFTFHLKYR